MNGTIEGNPGPIMRCWWITKKDGSRQKICVMWQVWPTVVFAAYPKHPGPDPEAIELTIEGVSPVLLREVKALDIIQRLSNNLNVEVAKAVREAVSQGLKRIQQELPPGVALA